MWFSPLYAVGYECTSPSGRLCVGWFARTLSNKAMLLSKNFFFSYGCIFRWGYIFLSSISLSRPMGCETTFWQEESPGKSQRHLVNRNISMQSFGCPPIVRWKDHAISIITITATSLQLPLASRALANSSTMGQGNNICVLHFYLALLWRNTVKLKWCFF